METTRSQDDVIARIDLGKGCVFEIGRHSQVRSWVEAPSPVAGFSKNRLVGQVVNLAQLLSESSASVRDVDQAAESLDKTGFDDEAIEELAQYAAQILGKSPLNAYHLLRIVYSLSHPFGSFWKHALLSSVLGYVALRNLGRAEESIPIFDEFKTVAGILTHFLGASARSKQLGQIASYGLEEAYAKSGEFPRQLPTGSELAEFAWSLILQHSWSGDTSEELYMQSESFARATVLLMGCDGEIQRVLHDMVPLAEGYATAAYATRRTRSSTWVLPLITLSDILERNRAYEQALRVLERVYTPDGLPSLMLAAIANREVLAQHSLGNDRASIQTLDRIPLGDLQSMSDSSITAQAELLLYSVARAEVSSSQGNSTECKGWVKEGKSRLRSLEQWTQIPSRNRSEDLRAMYCIILSDMARHRLSNIAA